MSIYSRSADDPGLGAMPGPSALSGAPVFSMEGMPGGVHVEASGDSTTFLGAVTPVTQTAIDKPGPAHLSLPPKLLKKILDLEFIEMGELIPESWGLDQDPPSCCHHGRRQSRRGPVSDILLWLECYSSLVAALATKFPQYVGDFMAYQATIIKAHKNFEGTAWVLYDRCYRRRAAALKSLEWAKIDTALYNEAFTGRARSVPRCQFCLSLNHTDMECPTSPPPPWIQPPVGAQPPRRSMGVAPPRPERSMQYDRPRMALDGPSVYNEVCQLFNSARCKVLRCKRRHVCNLCGMPHPELLCQLRAEKRGRLR